MSENNSQIIVDPSYTTREFTGEAPTEILNIASLGGKLEVLSNRKILFNQEFADKLLAFKNCPWERGLRDNHVEYLMGEMQKSTFLPETVCLASCFCDEDGFEYRINGQHCCWARTQLTETGKDAIKPFQVTYVRYKASTIEDVRRLYASYDRAAPRTRSNIIEAYLAGRGEFNDHTISLVKLTAQALALWLWESPTERGKHSADDIAYLMCKDHARTVGLVLDFCDETPNLISIKYMRRSPVLAAMLETFSKAVKPSIEFWYQIKIGLGFTGENDPRLRLRDALMAYGVQKSAVHAEKKYTDTESMYRWCISCWNFWRENGEVKQLRTTKNRMRAK